MGKDGYTDDQRKCIEELRKRMTGLMPKEMYEDDSLFLRFLIARDYDLNAAELMLKNHMNWRKVNKIDTLLEDFTPPEFAKKYIAIDKIGFTKEGLPVTYSSFGNIDIKGCLKVLKKCEIVKIITHCFETDVALMKKKGEEMGKPVEKFIYIFNLSNFSLATATHKPTIDVLIQLISLFDNNYPERLKSAYLINGSRYFTICWNILKPFIPGATFKKLKIYGKDGWKSDLINEVGADILPAFLGGNRTDPDGNPMCKTFINFAGKVPAKYFQINDNSFCKKTGTNKLIVPRMSKETVEVKVTHPASCLEWEFEVKSRDVGFAVLYKDAENIDSTPKEIVPKLRVDTFISSETGMCRCEKAGIYILEFDNTYSWLHSKEIFYTVSVLKPDQLLQDSRVDLN